MSSCSKYIRTNVFPFIENINQEIQKTRDVLIDLFNRFLSEANTNTLDYALSALDGYCYVPLSFTLWPGRYARYLDTSNAFDIRVKMGGFVVNDNGYTITLINNNNRTFRVDKRKCVWFMVMIDDDIHRIHMNMKYINNNV